MGVLVHELATLYRAASPATGHAAGPAGAVCRLRRLAARWLQGERLDAQLAYWRERLRAPLPVLELPTDRPRPAYQTTRGGVATAWLPPELLTDLKP